MTASGVDTCSIAFRPARERFFDALLSKPHRPSRAGAVLFEKPGPGKTKIGAFPAYGVVFCEGRLGAMLTGDEKSWDLRPKTDLCVGESVAREAIERLAGERLVPDDTYCNDGELRRYDLAHELSFDDPRDGLAFLRTVGGMHAPARKLDLWLSPDGQVQTVYWRTPKRGVVTERIYDKGVESGSHTPGERVRIEAQRRPLKSRRQRPSVVAGLDLAADFGRSMQPYLGAENVIAAGGNATVSHLAGAAARGDLSFAKAERMLGSVALLREYGRAVYGDDRKARRRLQGLREAGIALDVELPPDRVVPVGQLLRQAVEAFDV